MSGSQRRCPTIQYWRLFRSVTSSPSIGGQLTVVVGLIMRRFTRMPFQRRLRTTPAPSHSMPCITISFAIHQTLKVTPAMAAGVTDRLREMKDLVEMLAAFEASRKQAA
jgi:hypothetical protein